MRKTMTVLIAATALLGGCGQGESGVAQPVAERWDPCSIPKDAIAATGLDPGFVDAGWGKGISVPDWSLCTLRGPAAQPSYFLNIKSSESHSIGEARSNELHLDGLDLELADRDAFRFKTATSKSIIDCNIAISVPPGVVVFTVDSIGRKEIGADPCELVLKHTTDIEVLLPPVGE